jgi:CoA-transferase family III
MKHNQSRPERWSELDFESSFFSCTNRNKRSLTIHLKTPEGLAIVEKLAAKADILVENVPRHFPSDLVGMDRALINSSASAHYRESFEARKKKREIDMFHRIMAIDLFKGSRAPSFGFTDTKTVRRNGSHQFLIRQSSAGKSEGPKLHVHSPDKNSVGSESLELRLIQFRNRSRLVAASLFRLQRAALAGRGGDLHRELLKWQVWKAWPQEPLALLGLCYRMRVLVRSSTWCKYLLSSWSQP